MLVFDKVVVDRNFDVLDSFWGSTDAISNGLVIPKLIQTNYTWSFVAR